MPNADHTGDLKLRLTHDLTGRGRFTLLCPKVLGTLLMEAPEIDIGDGSWSAMRDSKYTTKVVVVRILRPTHGG